MSIYGWKFYQPNSSWRVNVVCLCPSFIPRANSRHLENNQHRDEGHDDRYFQNRMKKNWKNTSEAIPRIEMHESVYMDFRIAEFKEDIQYKVVLWRTSHLKLTMGAIWIVHLFSPSGQITSTRSFFRISTQKYSRFFSSMFHVHHWVLELGLSHQYEPWQKLRFQIYGCCRISQLDQSDWFRACTQ